MEYLFIILFIYASYLSIEKYVHTGSIFTWRGRKDRKERRATPVTIHPAASSSETEIIGKSRYQIRQSLTIDDNSGQPESGIEKSDTFTPEKKTEPVLRVREPLDKNTKFPEVPAPFQKLNYPEIDYMREASPSSGEEKEEIPERYEITGYVQRSNPHRATGVTFDDMDMIEKAMASDELTEAEQSICTVPASGSSRVPMICNKVVLPAPLGPTILTISPLLISRSMPFNTCNEPKLFVIPSSFIIIAFIIV